MNDHKAMTAIFYLLRTGCQWAALPRRLGAKHHDHFQEWAGAGVFAELCPTDRSKRGTKRSLLTDGHGMPLAVAVVGANWHDRKLMASTLAS